MAFCIDFLRFFIDFGKVLGGFWDDFSKIFLIFLKNSDFVKYSVFLWKNLYFSWVELLKNNKNQQKFDEKSMQISNGKKHFTKWPKKWIWDDLGLNLGRVWEGFGALLGALGGFWAVFGGFEIELL